MEREVQVLSRLGALHSLRTDPLTLRGRHLLPPSVRVDVKWIIKWRLSGGTVEAKWNKWIAQALVGKIILYLGIRGE